MKIQKCEFSINLPAFAAVTKSRAYSHIAYLLNNITLDKDNNDKILFLDYEYADALLGIIHMWYTIVKMVNRKEKMGIIKISDLAGIVENIGFAIGLSESLYDRIGRWPKDNELIVYNDSSTIIYNDTINKENHFDLYKFIFEDNVKDDVNICNTNEVLQKKIKTYENNVLKLLDALIDFLVEYCNFIESNSEIEILISLKDYLITDYLISLRDYFTNIIKVTIKATNLLSYLINVTSLCNYKRKNKQKVDLDKILGNIRYMNSLVRSIEKIDTVSILRKYK